MSGCIHKYNIVVKDGNVIITGGSISGWTPGNEEEDIVINGEVNVNEKGTYPLEYTIEDNYRLTELKVLLFLLLLSAVSCQRPMYDEEDDEDGVSQTNLPLKISARSSGESQINYPAHIYAFAEDGSCSASLNR